MAGLSDFDVMVGRLVNWGRHGRQDSGKPDVNAGCGAIYGMGRADRTGEESEEAPEDLPVRIDSQDAEELDSAIRKLTPRHYHAIRDYFYRRRPVARETVAEAIRALCDRV